MTVGTDGRYRLDIVWDGPLAEIIEGGSGRLLPAVSCETGRDTLELSGERRLHPYAKPGRTVPVGCESGYKKEGKSDDFPSFLCVFRLKQRLFGYFLVLSEQA